MADYVHGYSARESRRLHDQAGSVRELFHHDTQYPAGCLVLEAGCGVGAQTSALACRNPHARFTSLDHFWPSLQRAKTLVDNRRLSNVQLLQADLLSPPHPDETFDHVWVSHLLEHLPGPVVPLRNLRRLLKPNGSITVIEGDHGSCYFHPATDAATRAWQCLIDVQASVGGDSLIGRRLFPLLVEAEFREVRVTPRVVYADRNAPDLVDAFVRKTIIPMVEGVRERAIQMGMIERPVWDKGIADLHAVADRADGTFSYTFVKAVGIKHP